MKQKDHRQRQAYEKPCPVPGCRMFLWGVCHVIIGVERVGATGEPLIHLSISHKTRYPTWDEIFSARYFFIPDVIPMAMMLPPKEEYVDLHPNCFHLWEIEEELPRANRPTQTGEVHPGLRGANLGDVRDRPDDNNTDSPGNAGGQIDGSHAPPGPAGSHAEAMGL